MAVKKNWYEIVAPPEFGEIPIGEAPATVPSQLIGCTLKTSLLDIDPKNPKFYLKLLFKITDVDNKARTTLIGHDCMAERIHRMVRRRARRVDCIQICKTADGKKVRVKSVIILPSRVGSSTKTAVRLAAANAIERFVASVSFVDFVKSVLSDSLQKHVKEECKKIYPVGAVEIRASRLLK
jgi:small subunit ribosomal protein S3Ae